MSDENTPKDTGSRCRECKHVRGHHPHCKTGQEELSEWRKLFVRTDDLSIYIDQSKAVVQMQPVPTTFEKKEIPGQPKNDFPRPLSKYLEHIRDIFITEIVHFSYNFATSNGRTRLEEVIRAKKEKPKDISKLLRQEIVHTLNSDLKALWIEEQRALHFEKMKNFIRKESERIFEKKGVTLRDQKLIVSDIIRNLEQYCGGIEERDKGAIKILKNILAKMCLKSEDIKALSQYLA